VVIPKEIREAGHLEPGMAFTVVYEDGQIRMIPVPVLKHSTYQEVAGCLHKPSRKPLSEAQQKAAIAQMLKSKDGASKS
jgi:bifunctional DNA-binding transcriptional regulator/antitoxin component of YhaV-PrlF toxin-antitoxin module